MKLSLNKIQKILRSNGFQYIRNISCHGKPVYNIFDIDNDNEIVLRYLDYTELYDFVIVNFTEPKRHKRIRRKWI